MESVRNCVDYRSGCRRGLRRFGPLPQMGNSKMTKMTVHCGGSTESADIFRSFSFCNAWRRLAQFCSKKLTDLRSDREESFNFANLTNQMEKLMTQTTLKTFRFVRLVFMAGVGFP